MIDERLYELAFAYRKTRLWRILWESEIFAVKLSGDRTGYISIQGALEKQCAVELYIGDKGLESFRTMGRVNQLFMRPMEYQEYVLQMDCLRCAFVNKGEMTQEEWADARDYARAHGISTSGKRVYPQFEKFQPDCCPWHLQTDQEKEDLCEALSAAIEMAKLLKGKDSSKLGLGNIRDQEQEIPFLERQNGSYVLGRIRIPEFTGKRWPRPGKCNDISVASLKRVRKLGVWECALVRFPDPVWDEESKIPHFPVVFLAVESSTEFLLPVPPVEHYDDAPEQLLNQFMDALLAEGVCPFEIKVRDERTYAFLEEFCQRLKIRFGMEECMEALNDAEDDFLDHFNMSEEEEIESIISMLQEILDRGDEEMRKLPREIVEQLEMLVQQDFLPDVMRCRLNQVFHFDQKGKNGAGKGKMANGRSYVISVSPCAGCYRHIRISADSSLLKLHTAILDAFGLAARKRCAHAFFMDNAKWSGRDCYYKEGIESHYRATKKYKLNQTGLYEGMQFKYIYDFDQEWVFQCRVLRILEEDTGVPVVIRSKGSWSGKPSDT